MRTWRGHMTSNAAALHVRVYWWGLCWSVWVSVTFPKDQTPVFSGGSVPGPSLWPVFVLRGVFSVIRGNRRLCISDTTVKAAGDRERAKQKNTLRAKTHSVWHFHLYFLSAEAFCTCSVVLFLFGSTLQIIQTNQINFWFRNLKSLVKEQVLILYLYLPDGRAAHLCLLFSGITEVKTWAQRHYQVIRCISAQVLLLSNWWSVHISFLFTF